VLRANRDAKTVILTVGAPSYVAAAAADKATTQGMATDVIIVNGEETRADKRMCRRPPAARYAIAQA